MTSATTTTLTATVPVGATFERVRVTVNNRTAESDEYFVPDYDTAYPTIDASSLAAKVDFITGADAYDPELADLDGDGKLDLAVANRVASTLSVFRNTSTSGTLDGSSFAAKQDLTTGTNPYKVTAGDVDGDGELELIVTNNGSGTVSVFRNTSTIGSLSFAAKEDFSTGTVPRGVATGDLDGDGKLDLAVAHDNPTNVTTVLRNTSVSGSIDASSFATKVDFTPGVTPSDVSIGDVDGDGKPDLVVSNTATHLISLFHNTATAGVIDASSFAAKVDFATGTNPNSVVLGDLDGDGKLDMATANRNITANSVSLFRNTSTPGTIDGSTLAAKVDYGMGGEPYYVAYGDLDGDGKLDLVASAWSSDLLTVRRNLSTPGTIDANSFGLRNDFVSGDRPWGLAIGDVDGDGKPDIALANITPGNVSLYHNLTLTIPAPTISSISPLSGKVGDSVTITGTNFSTTPASNTVWFGGGEATVTSATTTTLTATVPVGATFERVRVTVNNRTAESDEYFVPDYDTAYPTIDASSLAAKVDFITGADAYDPELADLDGDGKLDLAVANRVASTLSVFRNTSTSGTLDGSSFAAKQDLTTGTNPYKVTAGDVDGDGELELIVTNNGSGTVSVFRNTSTIGSLSFAAKEDFSTGTVPRGVATGDLDGDGKLDLAVAHDNPTNVTTVLRNTSVSGSIDASSFATKVDFTPGVTPSDVSIGDVDGDGKPDLVVSNTATHLISLFHNTATAGVIDASSFAAKVDFATGTSPNSVVLGDLDGDGKLDMATANRNITANSVSLFRNTSTPGTIDGSTLAAKVDYGMGGEPYYVAYGDLDGDGKLDLVASAWSSDLLTVRRNLSTPGTIDANSFGPRNDFVSGDRPWGLAIGDVDGDGKPDIALANITPGNVSLYHNLTPTTPLSTITSFNPLSGRVGKTVTITGTNFDATPNNNTVYFGATKANPTTATSNSLTVDVPVGATFSPITIIRDNRLVESGEYFLPTFSSSSTSIDASTFANKVDFATDAGPYSDVAIGDLDGDGKPDLAVPNFNATTVSVFRNTSSSGAISLAGKVDFTAGTAPWGMDLGDTDGDGELDLVATSRSSTTASVFRNTSTSGSVSFATKVDLTTDTNPEGVSLGDLDGDGKLDIAVADKGTDRLSVFRNVSKLGAAAFKTKVDYIPSAGPEDVAIADVDGDGKNDLIASHSNSSAVSIFRNIGSPGTIDGSFFATKVDLTAGSAAFGMSLGDVDGDSKLDIAVANNGTNTMSVFRNTGSAGSVSFAAKQDFTTGTAASSVAMGDLNGDGKLDLAATSFSSNTVSLFRNTATSGVVDANSLAAKVDLTTGTSPFGVSIADLDGDGRTDVAVANSASNTISVFRNQSTLKTTGHVGAAIVGAGSEIQLFSIGLTSFGTFTLNSIDLAISDLDAPTGLISNDLDLVLYRSSDETFDSGDTQIGLQSTIDIGGTTTVSPTATETPTGHTFYIVIARMNTVIGEEGHAFKMGFDLNGVTTSAGNEGAAITVSESNKVTFEVVATHWEFTSQPTNTTHLELFSPQPFLEARDQHGNRDKDFNGTLTLALSPSGTLSQSDFTAADGRVVIDSLTVSGAGDGRFLTATGLGLTGTSTSFDVAKADATVTLNNLDAKSDGNPKVGGATTDPPGLALVFTHNAFGIPLDSPPIDPGAYGVTATVNDPNYQGSATGTLTIFLAEPPRAAFSASTLQGNPPLTVTFADQSTGPVETWFLEPKADDNRVYEDRNQEVSVTYSTPGIHTVFLTVRGVGITHQTSLDIIVNGPPDLANIADVTANEDETLELDLSAVDAESGTWTLTGADQTLISASSIQGDKITFTPVPHANGSDVVTITRTNVHGLSTSQDVTLTWVPVDDAPTIVDLGIRYSAAEDNPIHVGGTGNVTDLDSDVATLLWSASGFDGVLVGMATASNNGVDFAPVVNAFGETKATIVVTDPATGATATQEVTLIWTRVNDAPSTPVVGFPADGATDTPLAPLISWSARDVDFDPLVFDLFLGPSGSPLVQVASRQDAASYSSSELSPGTSYTWKVAAHDPSDATAEATFVFTTEADLRAPLISNVRSASTEALVAFNWDTDEPATSRVQLTTEDGGPATLVENPAQLDPSTVEISQSDLVREHRLTADNLRAGTWYRYEIRSTDKHDNQAEAFLGRVLTLSAPDGTAPLFLVDPYIEGLTADRATVRWRTDEPADSRILFSRLVAAKIALSAQESATEIILDELTEDHIVGLDALASGAEYSFEAQSADAAGNLSAVRSGSFTTGIEADETAPEFTAGPAATAITNGSAFIALEADELVTVQVRFDTDEETSDGQLVSGTQTQSEHQIQLLGLEPSTRYFFQVLMRDASGNETRSGVRDFGTRAAPDEISAEILAGPAIEALTDQSAVLVLTADEPVRVQLLLSTDPNLDGAVLEESGELQMSHTLQLTNLAANTDYFYEALVRDGANNRTPAAAGSFRTLTEGENLPPEIVELFAEGVGFDRAAVIWRTSEPTTGSLRFEVEGEGAAAGAGGLITIVEPARHHREQLTQLAPQTRYRATALALDAQGNGVERSFSLRTRGAVDVRPPLIETGPNVQGISAFSAVVEVTYNEPVELELRFAANADLNDAAALPSVERKRTHRIDLTGLDPGTTYWVGLAARDQEGNSDDELVITFTTDTEPDQTPPAFVTSPFVTDLSSTFARVRLELDEPASVELLASTLEDLSSPTHARRGLERRQRHALELTNLRPDTPYFFRVTAEDADRNLTTSAVIRFESLSRTQQPVQLTAGPVAQRIGDRSATVFFRLDRAAEAVVTYYQVDQPEGEVSENRGLATDHNVVLTNLEPGTEYAYTVGFGEDGEATGSFRTETLADTKPPKFFGPPVVVDRKHDRVRIEWDTDEVADSEILFSPMGGANAKALANGFDRVVAAKILADTGGERVIVPADVKNHEVVLTNLTPGTRFLFQSFCTDPAGNRVEWPVLDFLTQAGPDIAPPVMIGRPIVRGLTQSSFLVAFTTNEPTSATLRSADGVLHLASGNQETSHELRAVALVPETTYELAVCATDASGNGPTCSQLAVTTRVAGDRRAPRINTGPIVIAAGAEEVVVELTTDEPTAVAVTYLPIGGGESGAVERTVQDPEFRTFHRVVLSGLEPGASYGYTATVTDVAGNASASAAADFTTAEENDDTAPAITSGPSFQGITETGVTIVWTTDEPASSLVDWSIDAASVEIAAAKATATHQTVETIGRVERGELVQQHRLILADLLPGTTYHIVVTSKDLSSNSVTTDPSGTELFSRDHQFTTRGSRDTEAPTFSVNPTVTWTNSTAVVAWGTNERAASRIDWRGGGERNFVEDNALVRDHSLTATGLKPRTAYRFLITAQDQAGNKLTWGSLDGPMKPVEGAAKILQPPGGGGFFVTENVADSQLPLIVDGPRVREKTANSLTITWDTDELADSFVLYGSAGALGEIVGTAQDVTQHAVTLTNLEAGALYHYKVQSTDPSGNGATESTVAVVSTAPEVDLVPPRFVEEPTVVASTDDEIVLSWRTDEAAAARIEYDSPEGEKLTRQVGRRQTAQQVALDHLEIDAEYELSIYVNDASQNETPEPFLLRVSTDAAPDLEPPRILAGPEVKAITDRSASIVWTTDELADSYVDYHGTPYLGSVVGSPRYSFEHEVMLTKLEPDSTYYFRIGSSDRANNGPTVTTVAQFTTLEAPDIEPPAAPAGLQVTAGFSSILLEWTANDEDDLGGYSVYRENDSGTFEPVTTQLEEPRFVDENLEEGVLYRYQVSAVDQENPPNESAWSEVAEGTPKEANVPGAPEILGLEQGALASRPILVIQNAVPVDAEDVLTYTVQVSTNTAFRDIVARGGNIVEGFGGSTRWRVDKSLIPTVRYLWRARASYGPFDGPWSRPVRLRPNQAVVPLISEDFDGDGAVSFSDFFILANGFGSSDPILDLDRDGRVGLGDLSHLKQKFGTQVARKLLFSQGAEVAAGSVVDVEAEAVGDQVRLRLRFAGVPKLSGYGLSVYAEPPVLRYVGRVDSSAMLALDRSLSLVHETGDVVSFADHLKGRVAGVDLEEEATLELLFALDGPPQNVELFVQEGFLGRGAGRAWRVEHLGTARVLPTTYALYPNYPNPFNPSTVIPVGIPSVAASRRLELRLFNLLGQVIRRWDMDGWNPGFHRVMWDGRDGEGRPVASGVYLVQFDAGQKFSTRKLMLLR